MDRRPIKHRLSDINRKNVNLNKCITKLAGAPEQYEVVTAEQYEKERAEAMRFWEEGDPEVKWIEILPEDMVLTLPQNTESFDPSTRKKFPPLYKSRAGQ